MAEVLDRDDVVDAELQNWFGGDVIADVRDVHRTRRVIFRSEGRYSLVRGFPLGDGAGVSMDLRDVDAHTAMKYLLEELAA